MNRVGREGGKEGGEARQARQARHTGYTYNHACFCVMYVPYCEYNGILTWRSHFYILGWMIGWLDGWHGWLLLLVVVVMIESALQKKLNSFLSKISKGFILNYIFSFLLPSLYIRP